MVKRNFTSQRDMCIRMYLEGQQVKASKILPWEREEFPENKFRLRFLELQQGGKKNKDILKK